MRRIRRTTPAAPRTMPARDDNSIEKKIAELEELAAAVRPKISSRIRPCIIEFSGTPKSGKTSTAHSLHLFLRRNDFQSHFIGESGSVSPITDKTGMNFNTWSAATTLTWLLEALDKPHQFIIIDRGVFDSLWWILWHFKQRHISRKEKEAMESFFGLERWTLMIDIVFLMIAKPAVALAREHKNLLTKRQGRIMRDGILESINESIMETYQSHFKRMGVELIDTSELDNVASGERVVRVLLRKLNDAHRVGGNHSRAVARRR